MKLSKDPTTVHGTAELLPWLFAADAAASQIVCKDSSILGAWEFTGIDIESGHDHLLENAAMELDSAFRRVADSGATVWATMERRPVTGYLRGQFTNDVADYIDQVWGSTFEDGRPLYVNEHYLAAAMPTKGNAVSIGEMVGNGLATGKKLPRAIIDAIKARYRQATALGFRNREELDTMCRRFEASIASIFDNAVQEVTLKRIRGDRLLGYLKASASANPMAPVAHVPSEYLDTYLSDTFIDNSFQDYLVLDGIQRKYVGVYTLKSAPRRDMLQALNPLMAMPAHLRIGICWKSASLAESEKFLTGARNFDEMRGFTPRKLVKMAMTKDVEMGGDDAPTTKVGATAESLREHARDGDAYFGWLAATVMVFADSADELSERMDDVARALERTHMVFIRERDGSLSGLCAAIPGHMREVVRWHFVEACTLTDITPMVSLASGDAYHPLLSEGRSEPLPPAAMLRNRYNTVQYFNNHFGALGHMLFIGPSRNGKTIFQMFLESQFLKYPNARIFNIDKDYSCKAATLMHDGTYINLDPAKGNGIKMNPVSLAADPQGRTWLIGFIDRMLASRGAKMTDKEIEEVSHALEIIADDPKRRLTTLSTQLPEALRQRLAPWCEGGAYGMYFDHVVDEFSVTQITSTEVGSLVNAGLFDVVRTYADYAFYRIERYLNDRAESETGPTCIYFEEAGFLLDDPIFASKAKDYLMTLAKKGAFLVMTAQSPEPFLKHPDLAAAVRDNIATIMFLPNKQALRPELAKKYKDAFGVNDTQLSLIGGATPKLEYCIFQPQTGMFRVAQARLPPEIVNILRSDMKTWPLLDRYFDPEDPEWKTKYVTAVSRV